MTTENPLLYRATLGRSRPAQLTGTENMVHGVPSSKTIPDRAADSFNWDSPEGKIRSQPALGKCKPCISHGADHITHGVQSKGNDGGVAAVFGQVSRPTTATAAGGEAPASSSSSSRHSAVSRGGSSRPKPATPGEYGDDMPPPPSRTASAYSSTPGSRQQHNRPASHNPASIKKSPSRKSPSKKKKQSKGNNPLLTKPELGRSRPGQQPGTQDMIHGVSSRRKGAPDDGGVAGALGDWRPETAPPRRLHAAPSAATRRVHGVQSVQDVSVGQLMSTGTF